MYENENGADLVYKYRCDESFAVAMSTFKNAFA